jgi:catechol 2,3-dioxygenase-like lactoylglutathione lyase family enzyme
MKPDAFDCARLDAPFVEGLGEAGSEGALMNLNHLNLGVTEVGPTVAMFETYFGLRRLEWAPFDQRMAFLQDDSGALLSVFRVKDVTYPKIFHIGFMQETEQQVWDLHEKLKAGGLNPEEPREEQGRFTFYFMAPGGFRVEVNTIRPTPAVG